MLVGDICESSSDVIVNPTDSKFQHANDIAAAIQRATGEEMKKQCQEFLQTQGSLTEATPFFTTAGLLQPRVKHICHIVPPNLRGSESNIDVTSAEVALGDVYYQCLRNTDSRAGLTSISFPAIATETSGIEPWTALHAAVKAVAQFDEHTAASPGDLRCICFVNLTLSIADAMTVVCRQVFQNQPEPTIATDEVTPQVQSQKSTNIDDQTSKQSEWYAISGILKHQKRKGKDWYLVSWQGSDETSWVKRDDVSEVAIQQFNATKQPRKRKHH